ncbi:hypothetical protein DB88DRAFT_497043 [Papiliotrema laurentii]|uniref:Uncharacterized protein n=1 Tax=Papiliotrema laurentii TaxID=5418 RepID=A0AAD9CWT0_PAPLA|nr:hypothetical protein DB88DRAFT_497043 [Papiliotrema laurentii]
MVPKHLSLHFESNVPRMTNVQSVQLLQPPHPPPDLISGSLHLPLSCITSAHRGRKVRTTGQILSYDVQRSLLLLSARQDQASQRQLVTLLVDISTVLLGLHPSTTDPSDRISAGPHAPSGPSAPHMPQRQPFRISHGGWITVVGWLERYEEHQLTRQTGDTASYAPPLPFILEAIHVATARTPLDGVVYRGQLG